ncbi:MAG: EFR1 family ferrodoxin [Anaeroplasmataceae bacterium]|nr:EFR1 family ferrodoxin [Anaeroplasmataceae bacterium]
MKALICYFSGTGNTKKIVDQYVLEGEKLGHQIDTHKIEAKDFPYDVSTYDMLGIAYPIHAFNAPSNVVDFVKTLPKALEKKKLFILKSSGEPLSINNISSYKIIKILKKKNYILNNEYHYVMPYNMIFRHSDAMAYRMWNTASLLVPIHLKEIVSGKTVKLKHIFMGHFLAWLFRIEHWGGRFNGKKYKVRDNCINCQKCIRDCPVQNISYKDGKFKFGKECLMCTRCSFLCPVDAIKIGWFEGWKVNGAYNFNNPEGTYQKSHKNYCKRSYKKYFARSEQKIRENQGEAQS